MRRFLSLVAMILCTSLLSTPTSALLIRTPVDSSFVVVDDANDLQWADINRFADLDYSGVLTEIAVMNSGSFAGADDWHLASSTEMELLFDQMVTVGDARQFDPTDLSPDVDVYVGRYDEIQIPEDHLGAATQHSTAEPDSSTNFVQKGVHINYPDTLADFYLGAYVVSSTSPPIPEPTAALLFSAGLLVFVGFKKEFQK